MGFDEVFYYFFDRMSAERGLRLFASYIDYVLHFLGAGEEAIFEYRPNIGSPMIAYVDLIQQILVWTSIIAYLFHLIKVRVVGRNPITLTTGGLVLLGFLSAGLSETLVYLPMGYGLYMRTMSLFSSMASLYSLNKFNIVFHSRKKNLVYVSSIIMLIIVFTSIAKFIIRVNDPLNQNGFRLHSKMEAAVSWVMRHATDGEIVADLRTIGQLFLEITSDKEKINSIKLRRMGLEVYYLYSFNEETPRKIFRGRNTRLILSYEFRERAFIAGEEWRVSPPLREAFSLLNYYILVNRIFDDGRSLIYDYNGR
ncbi:MAG: hypothetical protein QXP84_03120 [Candidatus Korarchaeum sp.]